MIESGELSEDELEPEIDFKKKIDVPKSQPTPPFKWKKDSVLNIYQTYDFSDVGTAEDLTTQGKEQLELDEDAFKILDQSLPARQRIVVRDPYFVGLPRDLADRRLHGVNEEMAWPDPEEDSAEDEISTEETTSCTCDISNSLIDTVNSNFGNDPSPLSDFPYGDAGDHYNNKRNGNGVNEGNNMKNNKYGSPVMRPGSPYVINKNGATNAFNGVNNNNYVSPSLQVGNQFAANKSGVTNDFNYRGNMEQDVRNINYNKEMYGGGLTQMNPQGYGTPNYTTGNGYDQHMPQNYCFPQEPMLQQQDMQQVIASCCLPSPEQENEWSTMYDNSNNFNDNEAIAVDYSSQPHPQFNGNVEANYTMPQCGPQENWVDQSAIANQNQQMPPVAPRRGSKCQEPMYPSSALPPQPFPIDKQQSNDCCQ